MNLFVGFGLPVARRDRNAETNGRPRGLHGGTNSLQFDRANFITALKCYCLEPKDRTPLNARLFGQLQIAPNDLFDMERIRNTDRSHDY